MNDSDLQASVAAELDWDLNIDGDDIAVFVACGVVTLGGTVTSSAQKNLAQTAARRVDGVTGIRNQLLVRIPDPSRRIDTGLRANVLQAFWLDTLVPMQRVCPDR